MVLSSVMAMRTNIKKGELSLQYIAIAILAVALLIALLFFMGIIRGESSNLIDKFLDFIAGR
mgnify:CR=1 FL=1